MVPKALVCSVLWLTASALPAQFFTSIAAESRRTARATWLGLSGEQSVTIEYGQPTWRASHEAFLQQQTAVPVMLGRGGLTTLRTDVHLAFGSHELAPGRWYVGARRDEQQEWSVALFAADKVDASGRGVNYVLTEKPDLRVPVRLQREDESVELFDVALANGKQTPPELTLVMAWGPYRVRVAFAAAFDTRKPDGAPEFALTAADKGTRTNSGLIYEPLRAGAGATPGPDDMVRVHYAAWLTDGTMFDSSYVRGAPETLRSQWVVKGFAEGLRLMQPGATYRLTIPPELAYGAGGAGDRVPPNATLVFAVTLLGIDKP
jgi:hypothetical protein